MERRASAASFRAYQSDSLAPPTSVVNEIRDGTAQVLTPISTAWVLIKAASKLAAISG